jgi:APA family basic amino acid/polyamine antiporter
MVASLSLNASPALSANHYPSLALQDKPKNHLSLFDSICLIVGIIVGVGIYQTAPAVAKGAGSTWAVMGIWALGGVLSLCGALGYAELATAYPQQGGDYVYQSRAYGRWAGFLFGWVQLVVIRPGTIAAMAFAFATYAQQLYNPFSAQQSALGAQCYAGVAVLVLTGINILGVREGKWTQNALTIVKALGLLSIVAVALFAPEPSETIQKFDPLPLSLALILVMFCFGGWNEMAYVASEVKNPNRNIVRALVLGTLTVTALYLLANGAFLTVLGYDGLAVSNAVASDTASAVFPNHGRTLISALICISALGAVNGLVFTGARISYAVGVDHRIFGLLGHWHAGTGTPMRALAIQGAIALILIAALGSFMDAVMYTAAPVYLFFLATSIAVIVLRYKDPNRQRPYRTIGYPVTTLAFCAVCGFLIYSAVDYRPWHALAACGLFAIGMIVYWLSPKDAPPELPNEPPNEPRH